MGIFLCWDWGVGEEVPDRRVLTILCLGSQDRLLILHAVKFCACLYTPPSLLKELPQPYAQNLAARSISINK